MRNARARPQREFQTRLQVKERDGAIRELCANNTFGLQAKTIAVEPDGLGYAAATEVHERQWFREND